MKRMYSIGLTGGIGSGKSRVADLFGQWGAAIIGTDVIAHSLTAAGGRAIGPIRAAFRVKVIAEACALDLTAMRALVFGVTAERRRLEASLHPLLTSVTRQRSEKRRVENAGVCTCYSRVATFPLQKK